MKETAKINLQKLILKVLCGFAALCLIFFMAACSGKNNSSQSSSIFSSDETQEAGNLVIEANNLLKLIKQRFNDNEDRLDELQAALKAKDADKVKTIANELVTQINAGSDVGAEAINKLRIAKDKNINEDYKNYLDLKIQALEKYVLAFDERRQAAILLRDGYDPKNAANRDRVMVAFKEKDLKFKQIWEEAHELSDEANKLAKESLNRKK